MGNGSEDKLSEFFSKRGIYLLKNVREEVSPGHVFKSEEDGIHLQPYGKLKTILEHKSIPSTTYKLPIPGPDTPENSLVGIIKNKTSINIGIDFFQSLFDKIKSGLGALIRGKISNSKIQGATYNLSSISTKSIEPAELIESVTNYRLKTNHRSMYANPYYVVTKTWYCGSLKMTIGNLSQTEIEFLKTSFANQTEIKIEKLSENSYAITSNKKVAFGVNLASLDFDKVGDNIEIGITPHDKYLVPFEEDDSILFKQIDKDITD